MSHNWTVQFVGDYFTLRTHVDADDEAQATEAATQQMLEYYGWDVAAVANEIDAEDEDDEDDEDEEDYE